MSVSISDFSCSVDPLVAKVQVLEPKPFGGTRNAKDLKHFLWVMK